MKEHLKLGDGTLSIALLAVAGGAVLSMRVADSLVDRVGTVRVVWPAGVLLCASFVGPAASGDLATLCAALFVFGAAHGLVDVAMNVNATVSGIRRTSNASTSRETGRYRRRARPMSLTSHHLGQGTPNRTCLR